MHIVTGSSLQDVWVKLNYELAYRQDPNDADGFISARDFGSGLHGCVLEADSFGLTVDEGKLWYPSLKRRVNTLARRYVQPEHWEQGLKNMSTIKAHARNYSQSASLQFIRWDKIPTGGGCLLDFTIMRVRKYAYELHLNSRAVESVKFLTGDMHFMWTVLHRIAHDLDWPELLDNLVKVRWNFVLLQQSRDFTMSFLLRHFGLDEALGYLSQDWAPGTWPFIVRRYFEKYFLAQQPPRFRYKQMAIHRFFRLAGMTRQEVADALDFDVEGPPLIDWWNIDWKVAYRGTDDEEYRRRRGEDPVQSVGVWES